MKMVHGPLPNAELRRLAQVQVTRCLAGTLCVPRKLYCHPPNPTARCVALLKLRLMSMTRQFSTPPIPEDMPPDS